MEVGIPCLDADHIKLLEVINNLHSEYVNPSSRNKIRKLFASFHSIKLYHFRKEEILFNQFGYPNGVKHTKQHKNFSTKISDLNNNIPLSNYDDIALFLVEWFVDHILNEDIEYKSFFLERYKDVMKFCALHTLHNPSFTYPNNSTAKRKSHLDDKKIF